MINYLQSSSSYTQSLSDVLENNLFILIFSPLDADAQFDDKFSK